MVFKQVFGPRRDEVNVEWMMLHSKELPIGHINIGLIGRRTFLAQKLFL
jgi:hypothetical protein